MPEGVWASGVHVVQGNSGSAAVQGCQVPAKGSESGCPLRELHILQPVPVGPPLQRAEGEGSVHAARLHGGEGEGPHPHPQYLEPLCDCARSGAAQAQLLPQRDAEGCGNGMDTCMYMYIIKQSKATQQCQLRWLTFSSFQRKCELPQVGFEPTLLLL